MPDRALKISVRAASGQPSRAVSIERGVADWLGAGVVDMGTLPATRGGYRAGVERNDIGAHVIHAACASGPTACCRVR